MCLQIMFVPEGDHAPQTYQTNGEMRVRF